MSFRHRSVAVLEVAVVLAVPVVLVSASQAGGFTGRIGIQYPSSFAAIRDSWTGPSVTADSWATGTNRTVDSQYLRILAHNPAVRGHAYNFAEAHAETGPGMSDLAFQAAGAISKHAGYIEIALGENDVCGGTPKSVFAREFKAGLSHLTHALPTARFFVLSIENVANHWRAINASRAGHRALTSGSTLDCSLGGNATKRQLARVATKIAAYNAILSEICRSAARCRYDNGAVYQMRFAAADFDPYQLQELSAAGERALSATAWRTGYRFTPG